MSEWKNVRTSITVFVVLASLLVLSATIYTLKSIGFVGSAPITNTISVTGHGESFAKPDIATVSFSVEKTASTVADAQAQVTKITNDVFATLKTLGIAEKDIKTTSYEVYPKYEYVSSACPMTMSSVCPPSKQVLQGYTVSNSISLKIRDIASSGAVIGALGKANVTNISGLTFSVEDDTAVKAIARNEAISEAKTQAQTLAKQLGVRLVRITSFSESGSARPNYYAMDKVMGAGVASAPAPSISVGQNTSTSDVTITYEIQ